MSCWSTPPASCRRSTTDVGSSHASLPANCGGIRLLRCSDYDEGCPSPRRSSTVGTDRACVLRSAPCGARPHRGGLAGGGRRPRQHRGAQSVRVHRPSGAPLGRGPLSRSVELSFPCDSPALSSSAGGGYDETIHCTLKYRHWFVTDQAPSCEIGQAHYWGANTQVWAPKPLGIVRAC